jgi:hypothetical protein
MADDVTRSDLPGDQTVGRTNSPGNGHRTNDSLRAAVLERVLAAVERMAYTADEQSLRQALDAESDDAVLAALGLMSAKHVLTMDTDPANGDPLAAAWKRGEQAKRDILASQGELLDAERVATRLKMTPAEVEQRRQDGLLLALPLDSGSYGFPAWQFTDGGLLPGLVEALEVLPAPGPWSRLQFFIYGDPYFGGRTPLELLRAGETEPVRRLAAAYDELVAS